MLSSSNPPSPFGGDAGSLFDGDETDLTWSELEGSSIFPNASAADGLPQLSRSLPADSASQRILWHGQVIEGAAEQKKLTPEEKTRQKLKAQAKALKQAQKKVQKLV